MAMDVRCCGLFPTPVSVNTCRNGNPNCRIWIICLISTPHELRIEYIGSGIDGLQGLVRIQREENRREFCFLGWTEMKEVVSDETTLSSAQKTVMSPLVYFLPSIHPITPPVVPIITAVTNGSTSVAVRLAIFIVPYIVRLYPKPSISPIIAPA